MLQKVNFIIHCILFELNWHYEHWLIIFTSYPKLFPATEDLSNLECSLWHKNMFYEYLSWGIDSKDFYTEVEH